jgi:hypothetical protein
MVPGIFLIAVGIFHIWARKGVSDAYSAMTQRSPFLFPMSGYTPRACVLIGCAAVVAGVFIMFHG